MKHPINKSSIIFSVSVIILFSITYISYYKISLNISSIGRYFIINQTNITENSSYIHPMFKDPEANSCYSLKSLSMPEEIIELNAIAVARQPVNASLTPAEITFNQTHSILYGDPASKLIYQSAKKYVNKAFDQSYPHTNLNTGDFISIIKRIDSSLKLQFVVEIGSFTGNSAVLMGNVLKSAHPGSFLLCIDTWLGGM
jgi:hypothetical protein